MSRVSLGQELLDHLKAFDTPTICNALEVVQGARLTSGFTTAHMVCAFPDLEPIVGFARTATIKAATPSPLPPAEAKALRLRYYEQLVGHPGPVVTVIQDLDPEPGFGAFWGEVNTAVHRGLGVLGCITNGSFRDLDAIDPRFQLLAGKVGPSHAHVHVEAIDVPVDIFGMQVKPLDLIHADRHGAVVVPHADAFKLPEAIDLCIRKEKPILDAARSGHFDIEQLKAAFSAADDIH
jgi:regulator of RNase E activity RraA